MQEDVLLKARRFDVVRLTQDASAGGHVREIVRHPGSVTIVPLVDATRVCLIRNLRPGVGKRLIELPAGTLEPGEPPAETARRELQEETGYEAATWEPLCECYMSPGILDERMHVFLARDLTAGPPARESGEDIENWIVSWAECDALIREGKIEDAKTLVGLLLARQRLQTAAGG